MSSRPNGMATPYCLICRRPINRCPCEHPLEIDYNRHTTELVPFIIYRRQVKFLDWLQEYGISKRSLALSLGLRHNYFYGDQAPPTLDVSLLVHMVSGYQVCPFSVMDSGRKIRGKGNRGEDLKRDFLDRLDNMGTLADMRESIKSSGNKLIADHLRLHMTSLREWDEDTTPREWSREVRRED